MDGFPAGQPPGYYTKLNPARFAASWKRIMEAGVGVMVGAIEGTKCVGFFAGMIGPDMISDETQGIEFLWLVSPQVRDKKTALRLLEYFERKAKHDGCTVIICGCSAEGRPKSMRRMYRRLGFSPHSEGFRKVI